MHEEINEKSMTLAARVGKATADELRKAIEKLLADLKNQSKTKTAAKTDKALELKHGKQTLKQLSKHHDGLSAVELKEPQLRLLYREMKRHNVDFAAVKDGKGRKCLWNLPVWIRRFTITVIISPPARTISARKANMRKARAKTNERACDSGKTERGHEYSGGLGREGAQGGRVKNFV